MTHFPNTDAAARRDDVRWFPRAKATWRLGPGEWSYEARGRATGTEVEQGSDESGFREKYQFDYGRGRTGPRPPLARATQIQGTGCNPWPDAGMSQGPSMGVDREVEDPSGWEARVFHAKGRL
jgi:hypothetical protein